MPAASQDGRYTFPDFLIHLRWGKEENERNIAKVHLTGRRDAKVDSTGWRDEQQLAPEAGGMSRS